MKPSFRAPADRPKLRRKPQEPGQISPDTATGWNGCIQSTVTDPENPDIVYVLDLLNDETAPGTQVVLQPFFSGKPTQNWWYVENYGVSYIQNLGANNLNLALGGPVPGSDGTSFYLVLEQPSGNDLYGMQWTEQSNSSISNEQISNLIDIDGGIPGAGVAVVASLAVDPPLVSQQWAWVPTVTSPPALVNDMQGTSMTEGWDAIVAISAQDVNSIFQTTFANNCSQGETNTISATTNIPDGLEAQLINLVLGQPLIQFSPSNQSQQASLTIPMLGGICVQLVQGSDASGVISIQLITASQNYAITGDVPLSSVQGQVKDQTEVILDIANGQNFSAQLGFGQATQTALGAALQDALVQSSGYTYSLGTIFSGAGGSLAPVSFEIGTQVSGDPDDYGRVLLFVTTTGTPGTTTTLSNTNLIPQGYSSALFISSSKFFSDLLATTINNTLWSVVATDRSCTPEQSDTGASYLTIDADLVSGTLYVPENQPTWMTGRCNGVTSDRWLFGMSLGPMIWQAANNCVQLQAFTTDPQRDMIFVPPNMVCQQLTISFDVAYSATYTPYIDTTTNDIVFDGSSSFSINCISNIPPDEYGFDASDAISQVQNAAQTLFGKATAFTLPDIAAFTLDTLLFPNQSSINLETVYLPGDLVAFGNVASGNIQISPSMPTLAAGQSVSFTAVIPPGDSVQWMAEKGSIDQNGLYTAPSVVNRGSISWVTAQSSKTGQTASAVVALEPDILIVNPIFVLSWAENAVQAFTAAGPGIEGESVTWSISADGGGDPGTIDGSGNYTPPGSATGPMIVTVTAASNGISGTANILLLSIFPCWGGVSPSFVELKSGAKQAFSTQLPFATSGITWSVLPAAGGTIDNDGNYTAPSGISTVEVVCVIATQDSNNWNSVSIVLLKPA